MSGSIILGIAGAISWSLSLLFLFVFIAVIATVVRRHRPDAVAILLAALSLEFLFTLASFGAQLALPRLVMATGDMAHYAEAQGLSTIIFSLGHAASRALLIWGVARLAAPAR